MKALPTLLRLAKQELDALRRELGEIEARRAGIDLRLAAHAEALAVEQRLAMQSYEAGRAYTGYAAVAHGQRRALEGQREHLDAEADRLRALVAAAHVEAKKFERLLELQAEREAETDRRREDAQLDEMATLRAGRKA